MSNDRTYRGVMGDRPAPKQKESSPQDKTRDGDPVNAPGNALTQDELHGRPASLGRFDVSGPSQHQKRCGQCGKPLLQTDIACDVCAPGHHATIGGETPPMGWDGPPMAASLARPTRVR